MIKMPVSTIINIGNPEHYTKVRLPNNTTLFVLNQYLQKETKTRSRVSDFVPKPKEIEIIVPEIEPEIIEEEPEVRPFYLSTLKDFKSNFTKNWYSIQWDYIYLYLLFILRSDFKYQSIEN